MMGTEAINLTVPADFRFAKVVRLTAASIANSVGLNVVEVEDVRLAAEEGFVYASETYGEKGQVNIAFKLDEERKALAMEFSLGDLLVSEEEGDPSNAYAAFILGAVCDEYEITDGEDPMLRLVKRAEDLHEAS